ADTRHVHSSPTRRSSDLIDREALVPGAYIADHWRHISRRDIAAVVCIVVDTKSTIVAGRASGSYGLLRRQQKECQAGQTNTRHQDRKSRRLNSSHVKISY